MKKLVAISVLLVFLTAAAFAQFTVGIVADFYPDLLKATSPVGDFADENNSTTYQGKGTFDFFSSSDAFKGHELRVSFKYVAPEEKYGGELVINADDALNRGFGFLAGGDPQANVQGFLDAMFGDWNVWGKVGVLKGYVGNTADRGAAGNMRYNDAFSIFFDDVQVGNYGILLPGTAIDTFNLGRYARGETLWGNTATPYVSITADLAPIKVAIAGDMSRVAFDETIVNNESYNKVGAAVRVSGDKIADLVSFDAIYKIHGGDDEIDEPPAAAGDQPDAHGIWGHNFGLVANLSLLDSLGIGIGYSGYAIAQEKGDATGDVNRKYVYPYFNGIDLRLEFTGLDKLTVDFNNNISFAAINGSADANIAVVSPWPRLNGTNLDADLSASYLGLYNALGVKFQVTDDLFANFGIQHRLDSATIEDKDADTTELFVSDNFRALLGAGYSFGDHVVLETGLVFNLNNTVTEITNGTNNLNGGTFTFAIPIRFKVELP